ncbi:MAG: hypothetical protein LBQ00_06680 [Syntrophobacterales bacterium]|jgi:hypothetical protein|nr:hypothetical protein [Syntrophobacterales bacterium]
MQKVTEEQFKVANEIYEAGKSVTENRIVELQQELEVNGDEREAIGILKKISLDRAHGDMVEAMILYKVKEDKSYRKAGLTWAGFCEATGREVRTVDRQLADLKPVFHAYSEQLSYLVKFPPTKIRALGRGLSDQPSDFEGKTIEDALAEVETLKKARKEQDEELAAQKKAHERVQEDTHKTITKLEKELARHEKAAESRGLTSEEDAFLKQMEFLRAGFDGYMLRVDPETINDLRTDEEEAEPTARMIAAYLTTIDYMRKQILTAFDAAVTLYGDPVMCPESAWHPGMGGIIEKEN